MHVLGSMMSSFLSVLVMSMGSGIEQDANTYGQLAQARIIAALSTCSIHC